MSYNITETYSQKASMLKVWGESRMPYYNIEDGHTGVCYKVLVEKQFTAAYQEKELMITEFTSIFGIPNFKIN